MTTYEGVPSFSSFIAMKLVNRVSKAKRNEASQRMNRVRTWFESLVRLVAHLAGFSLLTWAGFTWNMTAGLIVAGISCFVFAWLMGSQGAETSQDAQPFTDPMASRR